MRHELEQAINELGKIIVGKQAALTKLLIAVLADGHVLLDDVPGVGKTTLATAIAKVLGLRPRRIQFTPDVLPSDIVGFSVYSKETGGLTYMPGIVCDANILLADEINRTSSKTQSALLEAMEERQVTVDGTSHPLQQPFIVIATQNNVGTTGTQLLPFAQLDRFLMRLSIGYPDLDSQMAIIRDRHNTNPLDNARQVLSLDDVRRMQAEVQATTMKDSVIAYIARLAHQSRVDERVELGISPRGALYIARAAKALAYLQGRDFVTPADVRDVIMDVCEHRLILRPQVKAVQVIETLLQTVPIPQ